MPREVPRPARCSTHLASPPASELLRILWHDFTALRHLHVEMPRIQLPPELTSLRSLGMSIVLDRTDVNCILPDSPEITEVFTQLADFPHDYFTSRNSNSLIFLARLAMLPTLRTLTLPALSPDVRGFPTFHYVTSLHVADTTETNVSLLGYFPSLTSLIVYREMSMPAVLDLLDVLRTMPRIRHTGFALDAKELEGKALRQLGEKIALLEARGVQTVGARGGRVCEAAAAGAKVQVARRGYQEQ